MGNQYLNLPFTRYDTLYLETLPDEVFFKRRFSMSEEDRTLILNNSTVIDGRRFYKAKVRNPILEKYAEMTNPKEGEPGSKTNPLVRFGRQYIYNGRGKLVPLKSDKKAVVLTCTKPVVTRNSVGSGYEVEVKPVVYVTPYFRRRKRHTTYNAWRRVTTTCMDFVGMCVKRTREKTVVVVQSSTGTVL